MRIRDAQAEQIASLYGAVALTDERATEAAVREGMADADVIHLATHGYLHRARAMSSGVLLTMSSDDPTAGGTANDGALQAWEILSQLKLRAELVVLSACETGRGAIVRSEGVVGLTRAFQAAGARAVIASQWKVADSSTATLMTALHRHLFEGLAKDAALTEAMRRVRNDPRTAHPFYWAPFLLVGAREAMPSFRNLPEQNRRPPVRRRDGPNRSRAHSGHMSEPHDSQFRVPD